MDTSYFKKRATVRRYEDKAIPEGLLTEMLEDAMRAPTTGGMQVYSAVVTTDKSIKEQLAPCHFNQPQVTMAPAVITFCADFNRFCKWCEASNAVPGYNNFQSFMTAVLDATIFAQQFNTIAEMNGLGCCYLGTTTYNADKIAEVLDLPKMVIPIVTITVGYPEGDVSQVERIPVSGIIHKEKYHDYSNADIKAVFCEKESLEVNKRYVKENNKETLAQVFTDVRYTKESNELFSKVFFDFIEKAGYPFPEK
jgi:nitroreductase